MSEEKPASNDWARRWLGCSTLTVADFAAISLDLDPVFFEGSNTEVSHRTSDLLDRMDHPSAGRVSLQSFGFRRPVRRDLVELWRQAEIQKTFDQDLREHPVNRLLSIDDAVLFAIEKKWSIPQWLRDLVSTCLPEAPPILTTTASDIQAETSPAGPTPESPACTNTKPRKSSVKPKRQTQADRIKEHLAECERRATKKDLVFDLQKMPGTKVELLDFLHNKDPDNLKSIAGVPSLMHYLKGVCKWSNGAHANPSATPLYAQLFPEITWAPRAVSKKSTQQRKNVTN